MALISLDEAKEYLRVNTSDDDSIIGILLDTAMALSADVARLTDEQLNAINSDENETDIYSTEELDKVRKYIKAASLYALAYLYEHREEADHHELTMTLRAILFSLREGSTG